MILKLIGNTIFFNFIKSIDNNIQLNQVKIKRTKNMVTFFIEDQSQKPDGCFSVSKVFKFFDNKCIFEYGCINLDFSQHWQDYFENYKSIEI